MYEVVGHARGMQVGVVGHGVDGGEAVPPFQHVSVGRKHGESVAPYLLCGGSANGAEVERAHYVVDEDEVSVGQKPEVVVGITHGAVGGCLVEEHVPVKIGADDVCAEAIVVVLVGKACHELQGVCTGVVGGGAYGFGKLLVPYHVALHVAEGDVARVAGFPLQHVAVETAAQLVFGKGEGGHVYGHGLRGKTVHF